MLDMKDEAKTETSGAGEGNMHGFYRVNGKVVRFVKTAGDYIIFSRQADTKLHVTIAVKSDTITPVKQDQYGDWVKR